MPALFAAVLALQLADLHSTLTLGPRQHEANHFLQSLAASVTLVGALLMAKGADALVVATMYWAWRGSRHRDWQFVICLSAIVALYTVALVNNYLGR